MSSADVPHVIKVAITSLPEPDRPYINGGPQDPVGESVGSSCASYLISSHQDVLTRVRRFPDRHLAPCTVQECMGSEDARFKIHNRQTALARVDPSPCSHLTAGY